MPVQTVIKVRRDTAANWISTNPTLAAGEMGLETDTDLFKFGNGTAAWTALGYSSSSRTTQIAKNDTGASTPKGSVVYISGANGSNALFSLADADTEVTSSKTVGLLAQTLATNGIGAIVTEGLLSGVNTETATAGQPVWLSSTAGEFVFGTPPAKPAHPVYLGVVTRAHATQGEILVKVQNGYELNELHDVSLSAVANNSALIYNQGTGLWGGKEVILRNGYGVTYVGNSPTSLSPLIGSTSFEAPSGKTEDDFPVGTRLRLQPLKTAPYLLDSVEDVFIEGSVTGWSLINSGPVVMIDYRYSGAQSWTMWTSGFRVFVVGNDVTKAPLASPTFTGTVDFSSATVTGLPAGESFHPFLLMGA